MSDKKSPQESLKKLSVAVVDFLTNHRFVLVIVIVGIALSFALIKTRSAINVTRNEDRYNEEVLKINYKQIDSETLESFRLADEDRKVEVNSNFDPTRQNPFTEN